MQEIFNIIIFSLLQGVLEFFPVSSSAHLKIAQAFIGMHGFKEMKFFLECGTFLAVLIYFRSIIIGQVMALFGKERGDALAFFAKILITCLPFAALFPFLRYKNIPLFLILGSVLMLIAEFFYNKKKKLVTNLNSITFWQAFIVGSFQVLSAFSGFSRSGSSICGGLLCGLSRSVAVKFSFLISLPLTFSSLCYDFIKLSPSLSMLNLLAFFACFLVACLVIKPSLNLLCKVKLYPFVVYRILLAGLILFV